MLESASASNRFVVDGFPLSLSTALTFERDVAECSLVLHVATSAEATDSEKELLAFYQSCGRLRVVSPEAVGAETGAQLYHAAVQKLFLCKFTYV